MSRRISGGGYLRLVLMLMALWVTPSLAYDQWSENGGDATLCGECHGDFRSNLYISNTDGTVWGNLHNIHRQTMLSGDCAACHAADGRFPTFMSTSEGGDGLAPLSCMGCHGRAEDDTAANPEVSTGGRSGYGAGLRQQHHTAGTLVCADCHLDADPAAYTPVGEEVLPPYYANPGTGHDNMPTSSCNEDGSENFAGAAEGLDNDGDELYDELDGDCTVTSVPERVAGRILLHQNTPNPFNPMTEIAYEVIEPGQVRLRVYDAAGQLVRTLVDAEFVEAGDYRAHWDGRDSAGRQLASGVYFYRLDDSQAFEVRKMILVK